MTRLLSIFPIWTVIVQNDRSTVLYRCARFYCLYLFVLKNIKYVQIQYVVVVPYVQYLRYCTHIDRRSSLI